MITFASDIDTEMIENIGEKNIFLDSNDKDYNISYLLNFEKINRKNITITRQKHDGEIPMLEIYYI